MKLLDILCARNLVSLAQLHSLVSQKGLEDDQLGSHLVEAGIITPDQLAQALSILFGVPPALQADFARADANLRKRLRAHQAANFKSIPLFVTASHRVAVAMVNPVHPKIVDELAFVLGGTIEPMVTSEIVLSHQLELLYSMPRRRTTGFHPVASGAAVSVDSSWCQPQADDVSGRLDIVPLAVNAEASAPNRVGSSSYLSQSRPAASRQVKQTQSYLAAVNDIPFLLPTEARVPAQPFDVGCDLTPTPPMVAVTGPDAAVEQIVCSRDRQAAADNLFAFMRSCFGAGAMFVVNGVFAEGRFGYNQGTERPRVEGLIFSLSLPSCFQQAYSQGTLFHGPPPPEGQNIHRPLWVALASDPPRDVLVAPVIAAGQTALLLYAQARNGGRVEKFAATRLEHVCVALGNTLVRLAGQPAPQAAYPQGPVSY
jgi:hypothetical protein